MRLTRRQTILLSAAAAGSVVMPTDVVRAGELQVNDDGLHTQPWFHESFLELSDDVAEAHEAGKSLIILWEQNGCPYCREMHAVNLKQPDILKYIQEKFVVVQLNLYGARSVTDFDGTEMEERQLARKMRVNFTPTISFFPADPAEVEGKNALDAEAWRLSGYWKPFHFMGTLVYVASGGYKSEPNFQRWLSEWREKRRAAGENVDIW